MSAGSFLNDLHVFDPATMTWALLSAANDTGRPSARYDHGFTSAGGRLYVHGGYGITDSGDGGEAMQSLRRGMGGEWACGADAATGAGREPIGGICA